MTTGVAVGLFSASHQRAVRETFRSQGVAFAVAFADAAEEWLATGDTDAIERAARLMLLGSVLYVQVVSGGSLQVDARRESLAEAELARVSASRVPQATYARVGPGAPALDVVVPLVVGGPGQGVRPDVALEVEELLASYVADLPQLDVVEDLVAVAEELHAFVRSHADAGLLVPQAAVRLLDLAVRLKVGHGVRTPRRPAPAALS